MLNRRIALRDSPSDPVIHWIGQFLISALASYPVCYSKVIIFYSVWFLYKKNNQIKIFKKINRNRTETGSSQPVSVWFLGQKPVQTDLTRFFQFDSVFSIWLGFFFVLGLSNPNQIEPAGFFKILIGFFSWFGFSVFLFTPMW